MGNRRLVLALVLAESPEVEPGLGAASHSTVRWSEFGWALPALGRVCASAAAPTPHATRAKTVSRRVALVGRTSSLFRWCVSRGAAACKMRV
jgi:hypothetical protein